MAGHEVGLPAQGAVDPDLSGRVGGLDDVLIRRANAKLLNNGARVVLPQNSIGGLGRLS